MDFAFSSEYLFFVMAVTITSLVMIIVGGFVKKRLQGGGLRFHFARKTRFRKKLFGFLLFIASIFLLGFLSERLQSSLFNYFKNKIVGIGGIIIIIIIAWFLYDWLVWKEHNE